MKRYAELFGRKGIEACLTWEPIIILSRGSYDAWGDVAFHEPQLAPMLNTYKGKSGHIQLATGSPLTGRSGRSYCSAASCPARRNVNFLLPSDNKKRGIRID